MILRMTNLLPGEVDHTCGIVSQNADSTAGESVDDGQPAAFIGSTVRETNNGLARPGPRQAGRDDGD
jgi:hypothetical protein